MGFFDSFFNNDEEVRFDAVSTPDTPTAAPVTESGSPSVAVPDVPGPHPDVPDGTGAPGAEAGPPDAFDIAAKLAKTVPGLDAPAGLTSPSPDAAANPGGLNINAEPAAPTTLDSVGSADASVPTAAPTLESTPSAVDQAPTTEPANPVSDAPVSTTEAPITPAEVPTPVSSTDAVAESSVSEPTALTPQDSGETSMGLPKAPVESVAPVASVPETTPAESTDAVPEEKAVVETATEDASEVPALSEVSGAISQAYKALGEANDALGKIIEARKNGSNNSPAAEVEDTELPAAA